MKVILGNPTIIARLQIRASLATAKPFPDGSKIAKVPSGKPNEEHGSPVPPWKVPDTLAGPLFHGKGTSKKFSGHRRMGITPSFGLWTRRRPLSNAPTKGRAQYPLAGTYGHVAVKAKDYASFHPYQNR